MLYISYGSNMNLRQMEHRCPHSRVVGTGRLVGWQLVFNVHADVIETHSEEDIVPVVLWDIDTRDWAMLDLYEGYPDYYIRRTVPVVADETGESVDAVVYVMTEESRGICPPSRSYLAGILEGCRSNGIGTDHIFAAAEFAENHQTVCNQYHPRRS